MLNKEVFAWLKSESEQQLKEFSEVIISPSEKLLGVRMPKLRKKAKEIVKEAYCRDFIVREDYACFEEKLLQGMVIGEMKLPFDEHLELVKMYVSRINGWGDCDSFCSSIKFVKKDLNKVWYFLMPYLLSDKEFEIRFGVVMLLWYFVNDEWINRTLDVLFNLKSEDYYAQMGIAWAISVCLAKYFDKTYEYMKSANLDPIIKRKSIQKGCESLRLTMEQKNLLRDLRNG